MVGYSWPQSWWQQWWRVLPVVAVKFLKRFFQIDLAIPVHEFFKQAEKQEGERKVSIYSCKSTCTRHLYQVTCTSHLYQVTVLPSRMAFFTCAAIAANNAVSLPCLTCPAFARFFSIPKVFLRYHKKTSLPVQLDLFKLCWGSVNLNPKNGGKCTLLFANRAFPVVTAMFNTGATSFGSFRIQT